MERIDEAFKAIKEKWNSIPNAIQIEEIMPMTRRERETGFCVEKLGKDRILEALGKIEASAYMTGRDKPLRFDNFMNLDTLQKALEGNYDKTFREKGKEILNEYQHHEYDWKEIERKLVNKTETKRQPDKSNDEFLQDLFADLRG